jgi:tRNA-splicing ligase RtcB
MEKEEEIGKTIVKMWTSDIDNVARSQIKYLASLPFVYHHIAIMPDCHAGMGMPIGGVLATKDVVIPNAVGVDIGCGMSAVKTNISAQSLSESFLRDVILTGIRSRIPLGLDHHEEYQDEKYLPQGISSQKDLDEATGAYKDISQVIALEADLVKIRTKLEPIAVIKG